LPALAYRRKAVAAVPPMQACWLLAILAVMLPAVDETFLASAPSRFVETIEVPLPADTVWGEL